MHTAEDGPERQSVEAVPRPLDEKHRVELDTSTLDPARTFAYRTSRDRLRIRFSEDKNDN
jgi:hypothetical protein